jgi:hypothetical protein
VLGEILTEEGHYPEAEKVLKEDYDSLVRVVGKDREYTSQAAFHLAELSSAEGKKADALAWLTTAIDHGITGEEDPGSDSFFKPLHGDPAFEALVAREHAKIAAEAKPAKN